MSDASGGGSADRPEGGGPTPDPASSGPPPPARDRDAAGGPSGPQPPGPAQADGRAGPPGGRRAPPARGLRRAVGWASALLLAATAAASTWPLVHTRVLAYDDEGYFLATVAAVRRGGALYDEVFTQYGPALFAARAAAHGLGVPATHDGGRALLWGSWLVVAALVAALVLRLTRSGWLGALAFGLAAALVVPLGAEAGHPRDVVALSAVLALLALAHAPRPGARRGRWRWGALGVLVALCLATKVNAGLLLGAALAVPLAASLLGPRGGLAWGLAASVAAGPLLLARPLQASPEHAAFALAVALAVATSLLAALATRPPMRRAARPDPGALGLAAAGLAGGMAGAAGYALATGTSPAGLVRGAVLEPARHPSLFQLSWVLARELLLVALAGAALGVLALARARRGAAPCAPGARALVATAALLAALATWPVVRWPYQLAVLLAPFSWLVVLPADGRRLPARAWRARAALAAFAPLWLFLAYPVAGGQLIEAQLALVPCACVALQDHARALRRGGPRRAALPATACVLLLVGARDIVWPPAAWATYRSQVPLHLPGAARLRASPEAAGVLGFVAENVRAHADALVTRPGLLSLHPWTGMPTLTDHNVTAWPIYLDARRQADALAALERAARPMLVVAPEVERFWLRGGVAPDRPLTRATARDFVPWRTFPAFELHVGGALIGAPLVPWLRWRPLTLAGAPDDAAHAPYSPLLPRRPAGGRGPRTLELRARLTAPGVLVEVAARPGAGRAARPLVYVGLDGRLRAQLEQGPPAPLLGPSPLLDGLEHHVLVVCGDDAPSRLFVDGRLVAAAATTAPPVEAPLVVLGGGAAPGWPSAPAGWFGPSGTLQAVALHDRAFAAAEAEAAASAAAGAPRER